MNKFIDQNSELINLERAKLMLLSNVHDLKSQQRSEDKYFRTRHQGPLTRPSTLLQNETYTKTV